MTERDAEMERDKLIHHLIAELRRQGIYDDRVLTAMSRVPREQFVPSVSLDQAWANVAMPIASGQTISQPFVVALMTTTLKVSGGERVLEIGTGSGYQAAVLAELVKEVYSIERHDDLATSARLLLRELGYRNVQIRVGDGTIGWSEEAPFDRIIVTAGAPKVPESLIQQLSPDGGRLVIPVGEADDQVLLVVERQGDMWHEQPLGPVRFVPLIGQQGWAVETIHE